VDTSAPGLLALADWRRRVATLYGEIRADPDPAHAWRHWCEVRADLFVSHPQSPVPEPARGTFAGPACFPYDPAMRVTGAVRQLAPQPVELATSDGASSRFIRFAEAAFSLGGSEHVLELFWLDAYGGGMFLSFRDASSGSSTYGGGRYLLDTVKGADLGSEGDRLILDLNFAYQPSCSYDPQWSCPLPSPNNRLAVPIEVGERFMGTDRR
jgi:uncharacterized protein